MGSYDRWSADDVATMKKMAAAGATKELIAQAVGHPVQRVYNKLTDMGLIKKRKRFSKGEDEFLEKSRDMDVPWSVIAATLGCEESTCQTRYRKLAVTSPRRYDDGDDGQPERKCLMHGGWFQPAGPHIFVCDHCKSTAAWKDGHGMG